MSVDEPAVLHVLPRRPLFGVEVQQVQEVIRYQEMTRVPLAPRWSRGLINLRGQIVTAIDLRRRLELPRRPAGALPMNVVVRTDDGAVSLLVDEIGDVVGSASTQFEPAPELSGACARADSRRVQDSEAVAAVLDIGTQRCIADIGRRGQAPEKPSQRTSRARRRPVRQRLVRVIETVTTPIVKELSMPDGRERRRTEVRGAHRARSSSDCRTSGRSRTARSPAHRQSPGGDRVQARRHDPHGERQLPEALGYTLDEIKGQHHSMFVRPGSARKRRVPRVLGQARPRRIQTGEYKRFGKGGKEIWIQASYNPILDVNGKPFKVVKYATDITAQKLQSADFEGQLAAIGKSQAVIEFNLDGTILTANDNFLQTLGYALDEIKGQHHSMFVDAGLRAEHRVPRSSGTKLDRGEYDAGRVQALRQGRQGNLDPGVATTRSST